MYSLLQIWYINTLREANREVSERYYPVFSSRGEIAETHLQDVGVNTQGWGDVSRSRHCLRLFYHVILHHGLLERLLGDVCHITVQFHNPAQLLHFWALRIHTEAMSDNNRLQWFAERVFNSFNNHLQVKRSTPLRVSRLHIKFRDEHMQPFPIFFRVVTQQCKLQWRRSHGLVKSSWSLPSSAMQFKKLFFSFPFFMWPTKRKRVLHILSSFPSPSKCCHTQRKCPVPKFNLGDFQWLSNQFQSSDSPALLHSISSIAGGWWADESL